MGYLSSHSKDVLPCIYSCMILILLISLSPTAQSKKVKKSEDNLIILGQSNFGKYFEYDCPLECDPAELKNDWFLFFFDMQSLSQENEFKSIFEGLYQEMLLRSQSEANKKQQQPYFAFIDCSSEKSLCEHVVKTPMMIILSPSFSYQIICYDGIPSIAGIRSLINTHDPETSMLVQDYQNFAVKYSQRNPKNEGKSKQQIEQYFWPYHKKTEIKQMREIEKEIMKMYKNQKKKQDKKEKQQEKQSLENQNKKINKESIFEEDIEGGIDGEKKKKVDDPQSKQQILIDNKVIKEAKKRKNTKEEKVVEKTSEAQEPALSEQKNEEKNKIYPQEKKIEKISEQQTIAESDQQPQEKEESFDQIFSFFLTCIAEFQTYLQISFGIPEIILSLLYYVWFIIALILRVFILILQIAL